MPPALAAAWGPGARPTGLGRRGARARPRARRRAAGGPLVVCGSLYLVGHVRGRLTGGVGAVSASPNPVADDHPRPRARWGSRTYVMGILNLTPDSFSGDGLVDAGRRRRCVDRCRRMVAEGADMLDIGGGVHPARPRAGGRRRGAGAAAAGAAGPSVRPCPDLPLSVDTRKLEVAAAALDAGADVLNDVSGRDRRREPWPALAGERGVPYVLMHDRPLADDARTWSRRVSRTWRRPWTARSRWAAPVTRSSSIRASGSARTRPAEPGAAARPGALRELGRPLLLGASRKSTIGRVLDLPPDERLEGTLATTALGVAARGRHRARP